MPEGDTIFRAAKTLNLALAGQTITRFETGYAQLAQSDDQTPFAGQAIERVEARGKHLLMYFTGDRILHTHMRMHGSWHIYRPGEAWQEPRGDARIVIETPAYVAVGFRVPVAEILTDASLQRHEGLQLLGPDLLGDNFDRAEAMRRLRASGDLPMGEALLKQRLVAGLGNVYKSEICFLTGVNPRTPVSHVSDEVLGKMMDLGGKLLRANIVPRNLRMTTGRLDPNARLWVYGRKSDPCRKCATPIERYLEGQGARPTYFCPRCQPTQAHAAHHAKR